MGIAYSDEVVILLPHPLPLKVWEMRRAGGAACLLQLVLFYFLQHRCTRVNSARRQFFYGDARILLQSGTVRGQGQQVLVNRRGRGVEKDEIKGGGKAETEKQEEQKRQGPAPHRAWQFSLLPAAALFPLCCGFFLPCCGHGRRRCRGWHQESATCPGAERRRPARPGWPRSLRCPCRKKYPGSRSRLRSAAAPPGGCNRSRVKHL